VNGGILGKTTTKKQSIEPSTGEILEIVKMNIREKTNDSSTNKELRIYVKDKTGTIYLLYAAGKKKGTVILKNQNIKREVGVLTIDQGLVDGNYTYPNEHELRKFIALENAYVENITHKLIKRVMLGQLIIELDDELRVDFKDDKYIRNQIEKTEKIFLRIIDDKYQAMYGANKEVLQTLLNKMEGTVTKIAKFRPDDFYELDEWLEKFLENPEAYRKEDVELVKIDE
jgi:hypothetical protein